MNDRRLAADIIGYVIAVLVGILLLPQIYKTCKVKHTLGLSIKTIYCNISIALLGVVYAILINEIPLLVGELILCTFSLVQVALYFWYKENTKLAKAQHRFENDNSGGIGLGITSMV